MFARTARIDRRVNREARALVRETRRALRRHRERLPAPVREQLHAGAVGLEKAGAAGDRAAQRRGLVQLDELVDEHLGFAKKSTTREYVESIAIAVLIALALRACVVEAFKIPSGSMIPTMEIGDHIFVNKFLYGLHIPFTDTKLFQWRKPRRGEVIVFVYPCDRNKDFIKRIVAVEGDTVEVRCNQVFVNAVPLDQQPVPGACSYWDKDDKEIGFGGKKGRDGTSHDVDDNPLLCPDSRGKTWASCKCSRYQEHNGDQTYHTIYDPYRPNEAPGDVREFDFPREGPMQPWEHDRRDGKILLVPGCKQEDEGAIERTREEQKAATGELVRTLEEQATGCRPHQAFKVPAGHVFVMGDNREQSADSRVWGPVPLKDIKGKAMFIWYSNRPSHAGGLQLGRIGKLVH